jgi:hypothetical protein
MRCNASLAFAPDSVHCVGALGPEALDTVSLMAYICRVGGDVDGLL